jgi:hypothetical protein
MGNNSSKKEDFKADAKIFTKIQQNVAYNYMLKLHNTYRNSLNSEGYNPMTIDAKFNDNDKQQAIKNSLHTRAQSYCEFLASSDIFKMEDDSGKNIGQHLFDAGSIRWNANQDKINFNNYCKNFPDGLGCENKEDSTRNTLCKTFLGAHLPVNITNCKDEVNQCVMKESTLLIKNNKPEESSGGKYYDEKTYSTALTNALGKASRGCDNSGFKSSWPTKDDNAIAKYKDARYCPAAYIDDANVVCPGLQPERNIDVQLYAQGPLYESQNVGLAYIKNDKGIPIKPSDHKITSDMITSALGEIFKKWIRGVCTCSLTNPATDGGQTNACGYCLYDIITQLGYNNNYECNAFTGNCAVNWANIVWANNQTIGVGNAIVYTKNHVYLLCVINYQVPPDINKSSFQSNMPYACHAKTQKVKLAGINNNKSFYLCEQHDKNLCTGSGCNIVN